MGEDWNGRRSPAAGDDDQRPVTSECGHVTRASDPFLASVNWYDQEGCTPPVCGVISKERGCERASRSDVKGKKLEKRPLAYSH